MNTENTSLIIQESNNSIAITEHNDAIRQDFVISRQNLKQLIDTGMQSLTTLARLAEEAEHPNLYKSLSEMMNTMTTHHKLLLDIDMQYKKHLQESAPKEEPAAGNVNIQNALFVGTAAELLKGLKQNDDV